MKSGLLWAFLYAVAVIPLALFGADMASSLVYQYDHGHRPRLSGQSYEVLKNEWDAAGALIGGMPGLLLVGWSQFKSRREDERERATTRRTTGDEDGTVWSPPPRE